MVHDYVVFNLTKEDAKKVLDVLMIPTPEPAPKEEEYIFKAGDVVRSGCGWSECPTRIIAGMGPALEAFDLNGWPQAKGQQEFKEYRYRKIGVLSDFIK